MDKGCYQINRSGGLSKDDRRYLMGEMDFSEYSDPATAESQRRHRIRKRIESIFYDLELIERHLDYNDAATLLSIEDPDEDNPGLGDIEPMYTGFRSTISFFAFFMSISDYGWPLFQELIEGGVRSAFAMSDASLGHYVEYEVDISIEAVNHTPIDEVEEKYNSGDSIDLPKVESLAMAGRIPWDDYRSEVEDWLEDSSEHATTETPST